MCLGWKYAPLEQLLRAPLDIATVKTMLELLCQHGANITEKGYYGKSALFACCFTKTYELLEFVLPLVNKEKTTK